MADDVRRRDLFGKLFGAVRSAAEEMVGAAAPSRTATRPASRRRARPPMNLPPVPIRPPGALDETAFMSTCVRCGACREACDPGILLPLGEAYRALEGTPAFFPETGPCKLCTDLPCIAACPSGALEPVESWTAVRMGRALIDPDLCLDVQGTPCDECALACPSQLMAIRMTALGPYVDPARCTGCGLCVPVCRSEPKAMRVVPVRA